VTEEAVTTTGLPARIALGKYTLSRFEVKVAPTIYRLTDTDPR
jgi:hypothetical protein